MISFCITVHNEHLELDRLLKQLFGYIDENDQIIVQGDQGQVTEEVISVLFPYKKDPRFVYVEYPLNKDFATFKNNAFKHCTNEWIFSIDADEYLSDGLLEILKDLVAGYDDVDLFVLPRKNTVEGITTEYAISQGWKLTTFDNEILINFPDSQQRLFKNNGKIKLINKVHERLVGYESYIQMPIFNENGEPNLSCCLIHPKTIERQVKQNQFYETINS